MDYVGESAHALRRMREGHKLSKQEISATHFRITCVCGWSVDGLIGVPDFAQEAGYMHRTEPDLRVPGSSDMLLSERLALMHQQELAERSRTRKPY